MEVIGGIANVAGTITVAVKLAEGIIQLIRLWHKVEDVPESIAGLLKDLKILSSLLTEAKNAEGEPEFLALQDSILENCASKVWKLNKTITKHSKGWESQIKWKRKWADLNLVLREDEIRDLRKVVDQATSLLHLHLGLSTSKAVHQILDIMREIKPSLYVSAKFDIRTSQCINSKPAQHLPNSDTRLVESSQLLDSVPDDKHLTTVVERSVVRHRSCVNPLYPLTRENEPYYWKGQGYCVHPPDLLRKIGLGYGLHLSGGWQYSLRLFRAVPKDALIFQFCQSGNIDAVRTLTTRGHASPWDRDPNGRTPLWVAVENLQLEVVEFLLKEGADCNVEVGIAKRLPISRVMWINPADFTHKIAILSLLQNYSMSGYRERVIMSIVGYTLHIYRPQAIMDLPLAGRWNAVLQLISHLLPEFEPNGPQRTWILYDAIRYFYDKEILYCILRYIPGMTEGEENENAITSCIHQVIRGRLLHRDPISARIITQKTPNLHRRYELMFEHRATTPTSLAMRQSSIFFLWRQLLFDLGIDIPAFVDKEIEAGVLAEEGWTRETLLAVFELEFVPWEGRTWWGFPGCERCGAKLTKESSRMPVDLGWRKILRGIRRGDRVLDGVSVQNVSDGECQEGQEGRGSGKDEGAILEVVNSERREAMPYRIVCRDKCSDMICVADIYEDEAVGELFPFPVEVTQVEEVGQNKSEGKERDDCPSMKIPGAFVS